VDRERDSSQKSIPLNGVFRLMVHHIYSDTLYLASSYKRASTYLKCAALWNTRVRPHSNTVAVLRVMVGGRRC
jgi:hypothetical protein